MKKKRILIETDNVNEGYKNYKKYKRFIYKNVEFIYNGKNKDIERIVKVLNIKSRRKRLEYIFDESCSDIDRHFKGENIW